MCLLIALAIVAFTILYEFGPPSVRYHSKLLIYYLSMTTIATVIIIPGSILAGKPGNVENIILGSTLMKPVSKLLGLSWIIEGDFPKKPCVVVVNHQHSIDVLGLFHIWPMMKRCAVLAKRELLFAGPFGIAAALCGTIFINRSKTDEAKTILIQKVKEAKACNIKVLVFPEGTRFHEPGVFRFLPFKGGSFKAAIEAQIPIVPVVISHYNFLDLRKKYLDNGISKISILDPISTENTKMNAKELADFTAHVMLRTYTQNSKWL